MSTTIIDALYNRTGSRWVQLERLSDGTYNLRHESGAAYLGRCPEAQARDRLAQEVESYAIDGHRLKRIGNPTE